MLGRQEHWNEVYGSRDDDELSWFEESPSLSLQLVRDHLQPGQAFIDVGGGTSRLVDALMKEGFGLLSVLDISTSALAVSRNRLGAQSADVTWIEADITEWVPDRTYSVWHDRAVFHFLTELDQRAEYAGVMARALGPGGFAIIATFAEDGPEKCSGLPVVRYSAASLAGHLNALVPSMFVLQAEHRHMHVTPKGKRQSFQYSVLQKVGSST